MRVNPVSLTISATHYSQSLPVTSPGSAQTLLSWTIPLRCAISTKTCMRTHLQVQTPMSAMPTSPNQWLVNSVDANDANRLELEHFFCFLSGHTCSIVFYTQSLSIVCNLCDICKQASVGPIQHLTSQQVLLEFLDLTGKQFPDLSDWQPHMLQQYLS